MSDTTLHLRTCLFHPDKRPRVWSGHVHLLLMDHITITVGLCKDCQQYESQSNDGAGCSGCYGIITNLR